MSGDELEKLKSLHRKIFNESVIKWTELLKLDDLDLVILSKWQSVKFPGSLENWLDLLIEQYSKRKIIVYKRKLKWQALHFAKVLKNYERKANDLSEKSTN
jgi:hypothetical protein